MNPNHQKAINISSSIFAYVDTSFEDALDTFNAAKGTLAEIRQNGSDFLDNSLSDYKNINTTEIG